METKLIRKRLLAFVMALAVIFTSVAVPQTDVSAASAKAVKSVTLKIKNKTVTKKTVTMYKGSKAALKVVVKPSSAKKSVAFKTSKKSVATVDKKGVITAKKAGKAKITVTVTGKNKKKKTTYVTVNVKNKAQETPETPETPKPTTIDVTGVNASIFPSGTISVGDQAQITASVAPENATDKSLSYFSANSAVATVTNAGIVTGVGVGNTVIRVSASNGKYTDVAIAVQAKTVDVASVTVNVAAGTIAAGESTYITAGVLPENATDKTLTYTSSNQAVAVVNNAGAITGISAGTAVIRATASNGKYAEVTITVTDVKVTSVKLDKNSAELTVSGTTTLKAIIEPENAKDKTVTWTSANNAVATVTQDGVVTGVGVGTTRVKVVSNDGGFYDECEVTVKSSSILADGITAEVTNAYVDNMGREYPNTVLVGDDMSIRVRVVKDGQPLGNANVTLKATSLYGNSQNYFKIRQDYLTTNNDGYATFTFGLTSDYADVNAVQNIFQSYKLTATDTSSNQSTEITAKFASVELNGIVVENNQTDLYDDIVPSDNAAVTDTGIYTTRSSSGVQEDEYVTSQQVSSYEDDHRVYLTAEPYLIMPATSETAHIGDWTYDFTGEEGKSGSYSVYNTETDQTTTTTVNDVPAGLQYITLYFDKIDLSKYTAMYIDVYSSEDGVSLDHKEVTNAGNTGNSSTVQMKVQKDIKSYLVVSIVSQGQVEDGKEGYILKKVTGPWATENNELTTLVPLEGTVTWEDVSNEYAASYETTEWNYQEAKDYLPADSEFANPTYKYSYKVPAFPYAGDAIITVKDANDKLKAYFLYPTVIQENADGTYNNVNVLAPAGDPEYAILASEEEVTQIEKDTLSVNGNQAIVDTQISGVTALVANIQVKGLDETELSSVNGGKLYTSVQWSPVPKKEEEELVEDYYAIEGQTVTVVAQLFDKNHNAKSDSGQTVQFYYGDEEVSITKQGQEIGGENGKNTVTVTGYMSSTNEKGQVTLQFQGEGVDYVESLTAKATGYNVGLSFETGKAPSDKLTKANVYWVDLGTTFVDSAVKDDAPVRTTNFTTGDMPITKSSSSEVGKRWKIGYLPVAQSHKFAYSNPDEVERGNVVSEFISIDNIAMRYTKSGEGSLENNNNAAFLTSEKIGKTTLTGDINISATNMDNVTFHFYDENGEVVSYKNIGKGDIASTVAPLQLTLEWTLSGLQADIITPNGTSVDKDTDTNIYVSVLDNYNNKVSDLDVAYTLTYKIDGQEDQVETYSAKTDENGIVEINMPAPGQTVKCNVTVKIGDDINKNVTIAYVDTATVDFGITADDGDAYAVEIVAKDQLKLYFTNRINPNTINSNMFKFVQDGSTDVQYVVQKAEMTDDDDKAILLTLDKEIVNQAADHTISISSYTDKRGITYDLMDGYGQKIEADSSYTFKPSERSK